MGLVGDTMRGMARKVDPSYSETVVSITAQGKERGASLLGTSRLALILGHLTEFSPQSITEIAHSCELPPKFVKHEIDAYPQYFEVRVR